MTAYCVRMRSVVLGFDVINVVHIKHTTHIHLISTIRESATICMFIVYLKSHLKIAGLLRIEVWHKVELDQPNSILCG